MSSCRAIQLILLAACVLPLAAACAVPEQVMASPDEPVRLRPPARAFVGRDPLSLVDRAQRTVADLPLTTALMRDVAQRAERAVVSIYIEGDNPHRLYPLGLRIPGTSFRVHLKGDSLGSGFFVHESGLILTNDHVVRYAKQIRVLTKGGLELPATLVAHDPVYDLALLKVTPPPGLAFLTIPMGDSNAMQVGEPVMAVGNPLGLGFTVTAGVVSQTDRNLMGVRPGDGRGVHFLQTDATIAPGSSGGPLITLTGAWV
ncbi:MAG: hypothetical protein DRQ55_06340, partial [Planctomycetota bacterium]